MASTQVTLTQSEMLFFKGIATNLQRPGWVFPNPLQAGAARNDLSTAEDDFCWLFATLPMSHKSVRELVALSHLFSSSHCSREQLFGCHLCAARVILISRHCNAYIATADQICLAHSISLATTGAFNLLLFYLRYKLYRNGPRKARRATAIDRKYSGAISPQKSI